nr:hypothetical protein [uncultured Devosia sp.]
MTNLAHITETALLLLAAYLLGCAFGYAVRIVLHAGRGTRQVTPTAAVAATSPDLRKPRSSAARLAASAGDEPPARNVAPIPVASPPRSGIAAVASATPGPSPTPPATVHVKPASKAKSADPKPVALDQPRDGQPDNLKQIKGIGPKIEASLYAMGIFHIDQIAGWTKANVEWVDAQLSFKGRIRRERWVEQATELSAASAGAPPRLSNRV